MRTTKAQAYLAAEEAELERRLTDINAECRAIQGQLAYVKRLRAKLAEAPKRTGVKKTRLPSGLPSAAAPAAPAGDGATSVAT